MRSSAALAFLLAGCGNFYYLDLPDVTIRKPDDLDQRMLAYERGQEKWHGDPREVADRALRRHLDLPWKADPYSPSKYQVHYKREWGVYVIRGYSYPSGHHMRYRVKVKAHSKPGADIWYPTVISRYKIHEIPDEDAKIHGHFKN